MTIGSNIRIFHEIFALVTNKLVSKIIRLRLNYNKIRETHPSFVLKHVAAAYVYKLFCTINK
jgi:hypothetical protein